MEYVPNSNPQVGLAGLVLPTGIPSEGPVQFQ